MIALAVLVGFLLRSYLPITYDDPIVPGVAVISTSWSIGMLRVVAARNVPFIHSKVEQILDGLITIMAEVNSWSTESEGQRPRDLYLTYDPMLTYETLGNFVLGHWSSLLIYRLQARSNASDVVTSNQG